MPQLMPLSWISSSLMILLIVVSSCTLYSEYPGFKNMTSFLAEKDNKNKLWFW